MTEIPTTPPPCGANMGVVHAIAAKLPDAPFIALALAPGEILHLQPRGHLIGIICSAGAN